LNQKKFLPEQVFAEAVLTLEEGGSRMGHQGVSLGFRIAGFGGNLAFRIVDPHPLFFLVLLGKKEKRVCLLASVVRIVT